ncbi:hypothetical protein, partial [Plesiomonas shigelloides]|uniref:hypothetical protein n=1 Tax=Plesiomonas shigelloides TaxID=703 RepID=UPI001E3BD743
MQKNTDFVQPHTMLTAGKNTIFQFQQTMLFLITPQQQYQLTGKKAGLHSPIPLKLQRAHSPTMFKNGK